MAHYKKLAKGWRVQVERAGVRTSGTFSTKSAAEAWAAREEADLLAGKRGQFPAKSVADAFRRYEREVSTKKRNVKAESLRFAAFERLFPGLAAKVISQVTTADLVEWREARLRVVSASSVVREAAQLRNVWTVAAREWLWCADPSPWRSLKLPAKAHARTRRTHWTEVRRLLRHMGYITGHAPRTPQQEVAYAYLLAQHTAMRAGEVRELTRSRVDLRARVARLDSHKTLEREGVRFVPLTRRAVRVMAVLDAAACGAGRDGYFTIGAQSLDVLFRKVRDRLMLDDLHFHDSRADALTRFARRVDVMTLARISGHRDLRQLMDAYYRESAADIAARLP